MTAAHRRIEIAAGFLPLLDAAPLIVASAKGFARAEGVDLRLLREQSWAALRDRISIGHIDAAHMPAPLPIATTLGLGSLAVELEAPIALARGGNAVTVSLALWGDMKEAGAPVGAGDPVACARALKLALDQRRRMGAPRPIFGVVHPFSSHNYELRHWLSVAGILPDQDVQIVILPPPYMADALGAGRIDGFCVGEPWNTLARHRGVGRLVTTKPRLWPGMVEKVLAMRSGALAPDAAHRLICALAQAANWCDEAGNREELARLLAQPEHMDLPEAALAPGLSAALALGDAPPTLEPDFLRFGGLAGAPEPLHALWLYGQMVRWGQTLFNAKDAARAMSVYRLDVWSAATGRTPPAPRAITGFDGVAFDGSNLEAWLGQYGPPVA
jgi:NitT/TauT family transport system ATP-binding protein